MEVSPEALDRLRAGKPTGPGKVAPGYVNQASGGLSEFGSTARLNPIADVQPEYLIVAGTSNDDTSAATVGAAVTALYAVVPTRSPKTRIIVVGPQNTSSNVSANREAVRTAILSAANAAPNVIGVIDPITEQWITGTGTVSAPGTAGKASVFVGGTTGADGAHLNQKGYDYWGAAYPRCPASSCCLGLVFSGDSFGVQESRVLPARMPGWTRDFDAYLARGNESRRCKDHGHVCNRLKQ